MFPFFPCASKKKTGCTVYRHFPLERVSAVCGGRGGREGKQRGRESREGRRVVVDFSCRQSEQVLVFVFCMGGCIGVCVCRVSGGLCLCW